MEYLYKPFNVLLRRVLAPYLCVKPIVPKCIVGRACYAAMDALTRKLPQRIERVAVDDYVGFQCAAHASPTSSGFVVITR